MELLVGLCKASGRGKSRLLPRARCQQQTVSGTLPALMAAHIEVAMIAGPIYKFIKS